MTWTKRVTPRMWKAWTKEDGKKNVVRTSLLLRQWDDMGFELKPKQTAFMFTLFGPDAGPVFANFQVQPKTQRDK